MASTRPPDEGQSGGNRRTEAHDAAAVGARWTRHRSGSTNASSRSTVTGDRHASNAPHEPQVNRADDGGPPLSEFEERAMAQSDLCFAVRFPPLRASPSSPSRPTSRLIDSCTPGALRVGRVTPCAHARLAVGGPWRWRCGRRKAQGENLGEQAVAPSTAGSIPRTAPEHQRRTAWSVVARFDALDPAVGYQGAQMEPDGIGVHCKLICDRHYRHRVGPTLNAASTSSRRLPDSPTDSWSRSFIRPGQARDKLRVRTHGTDFAAPPGSSAPRHGLAAFR